MQLAGRAVAHVQAVDNRWRSRDQLQIEFAVEPFLNDFHVQQAKKAATESKAECLAGFRLVGETGIVEAQFGEAIA